MALKVKIFVLFVFAVASFGCADDGPQFPVEIEIGNSFLLRTDLSERVGKKFANQLNGIVEGYEEFIPFPSKRNRRFKVTVFKDSASFAAYRDRISSVKSSTGFYVPDRGELGLLYQGFDATSRSLAHEVFHAYFEDRVIHPPAWLNEGLAEYAETMNLGMLNRIKYGSPDDRWLKLLGKLSRKKQIPHIQTLVEEDWPRRHQLTNEQYAISWSIAYFFVETNDKQIREDFYRFLQLLYDKKNPRKAFFEVWPNADNLNDAWRSFIKKEVLKSWLPF